MRSRRGFLKIAGGAGVVLGAGLAWRAWDQGVFSTGEGPAYAPWRDWQSDRPTRVHCLIRAAILAANPHNTQPWRFRLTQSSVDLFADRSRNIGAIDPYLREMHVGLGCALENLLLAARASGFAYELELFPDTNDVAHVARIRLRSQTAALSPLYGAIPHRHTNRGPYDAVVLDTATFDELQALGADLPRVSVQWITGAEPKRQIGDLIVQATRAIIADREQSRDSAAWFRADWHDIQTRRDGLTVDAQALPTWLRLAAKILPPASQEQADSIWLKNTREVHVATAAAYGIILARDASANADRVEGGRLWQRMQLHASTRGIAMQPLNQLPERADRERALSIQPRYGGALKDVVARDGWEALMPFRLGRPLLAARPSPRRAAKDVIIT